MRYSANIGPMEDTTRNEWCCMWLCTEHNNFTIYSFNETYDCYYIAAIRLDGCNVGAYTYWSLLDSLEWSVGYSLKFGLYKVDFNDPRRRRTAKASTAFYTGLIKDNGWKCPARNPYLSRINSCPPERTTLPVPTPSDYEQIYNHRDGCWRRRTNTRRCRVIGLQTHCEIVSRSRHCYYWEMKRERERERESKSAEIHFSHIGLLAHNCANNNQIIVNNNPNPNPSPNPSCAINYSIPCIRNPLRTHAHIALYRWYRASQSRWPATWNKLKWARQ